MKMMMKNSILALLSCIMLAGCAALGKYESVSQVAEDKFGDLVEAGQENSIANISWQEMFTDKDLQDYINLALQNNHDLLAAEEHIHQAEAGLLAAKLAYTPTLGLSPTFGKTFSGDNLSADAYSYKLNATTSWQLAPMRLINNQKSAQATVEQMEDARQAVLSSLVASVANTYYTLLMLDAQREASKEMEDSWKKSVETIKAMKEAGLADQVAVSQYEANYNSIRITAIDIDRQILAAENSLCLLTGMKSSHGMERSRLKDQSISYDLSVGLPVNMLTLRPDVRAAQRDMELAFYTTKGAVLNYFPALSINGSLGLVNPASGAVSPMGLLAEISASLVAPIFKAGANSAALKKAQSLQKESRIAFDKTLMTACKEVNDYYGAYCKAREASDFHEAQVASLDQARKDTEYLMLNSFDKTYLDVLYANTNYFDAVISMISNKAKQMQEYVNLYAALGGGTF